ncbi:MAG: LOW QUALITY PROTEIN: uncharacterized protein KVP18_003315 [Porospora cf. gigantea A]|uniref:uncharacterized protein n=1 Tax=Porospora cf. gigantea A TaxID=2853593 RepID=UPI0035599F10|nr:MAG: LOW QUALITY PROTEIN: hypothetical protein KVP18_003315 [Porospora cf. gigantea A]
MRTAIPALCIAGASHLSPIQTPPNDPRTAAVALLPNGLRTLLVQDPSASRAAFSLTFNVGSWDDPVELPGMAHWSEHSLFLGSFAHDKPSAFDVFLSSRGGRVNAYTSSTQTVFFASLVVSGLADGLSRFSALFRLPSLHADRVIREVHNVNSEHSKNLSNDVARMWEIIIDHLPQPFDKFATGTQNSLVQDPQELGIDSPLKLKRFVSTHYCARNAAAAVISPLDMEAILPAVEATFGRILPDKHGQCRHAPRVLTGDIQAASFKMKGAVPTTVLAVPLPASRRPMFASLLGDTLSSLVRDTCLQNTGKVSSFLDVHIENPTSEFPLLALAVPMDDNIDAVRSVVAALLSLLKNVRKGEHKNYFEKATSNAKKRESLTSPSSDLLTEAGSLSSSLALVHSDEEMSGVFSSFAGDDAELWTEFSQLVKGIQVETPLVVWMTRQPVKPDHVEPWYKTPYEDVDLLNSPELIRWTKQPAVEACANHKLAKSKMKLLRTGSLWSGGFRTAIPTTTVRLLYTAPSETDMLTLSLLHQYISHSMDTFTSSKIGSRLKDCGVEISAGYTPDRRSGLRVGCQV